jgi:hypothetical protein
MQAVSFYNLSFNQFTVHLILLAGSQFLHRVFASVGATVRAQCLKTLSRRFSTTATARS